MTVGNAVRHPVEVTHDTELLRLLLVRAHAQSSVTITGLRCLSQASQAYVDHQYKARVPGPGYTDTTCKLADLADGTLFYQSKTFHRGEEGYWIKGTPYNTRASVQDALPILKDMPADARNKSYADRVLNEYKQALSDRNAALADIAKHEKNYTGWSRFFLVTSSPGHVHSSMSCSSCYSTTEYAPVVELSGCTEAEAIELLGETLCTVCFPNAPVRPGKITKAQVKKLVGL